MKKTKRYEEGGVTEGPNKNIGDDVRARAMAAIAAGGQKDEAAPAVKKAAPKAAPKSAPRVEVDIDAENEAESQRLFNKKPVDSVSKENPAAVAKAYQTAAKMQASKPKGMKSGGKVAGRLATRGYGIAKK
jgi:hypothetical protein